MNVSDENRRSFFEPLFVFLISYRERISICKFPGRNMFLLIVQMELSVVLIRTHPTIFSAMSSIFHRIQGEKIEEISENFLHFVGLGRYFSLEQANKNTRFPEYRLHELTHEYALKEEKYFVHLWLEPNFISFLQYFFKNADGEKTLF